MGAGRVRLGSVWAPPALFVHIDSQIIYALVAFFLSPSSSAPVLLPAVPCKRILSLCFTSVKLPGCCTVLSMALIAPLRHPRPSSARLLSRCFGQPVSR
jgi:hypothetical protein